MEANFVFRHQARIKIVQALYCEMYTGYPIQKVMFQFLPSNNFSRMDIEYFVDVFQGTVKLKNRLDECIEAYTNDGIASISSIELCTLRMAAYELSERKDIPFQVIINEAVEISREFTGDRLYRRVNGILDNVARDIRPDEVKEYRDRRKKQYEYQELPLKK